jgi:hypothetical protein
MRLIVFLLFVLLAGQSHANDTLTRAEVYDWAVGDTFDYMHDEWSSYGSGAYYHYSDTSHLERFVITGISWSADSLSKSIARIRVFPYLAFDTLRLPYLNKYEIKLDTIRGTLPGDYTAATDTVQDFWGFKTNGIQIFPSSSYVRMYQVVARYIGNVWMQQWGGLNSWSFNNVTKLVYYSGVHGTFGRCYESLLSSLNGLSGSDLSITIYPNATSDKVRIDISGDQKQVDFVLYDVQGRAVKHVILESNIQELSLADMSSGVYVWKASGANNTEQHGRIVKE